MEWISVALPKHSTYPSTSDGAHMNFLLDFVIKDGWKFRRKWCQMMMGYVPLHFKHHHSCWLQRVVIAAATISFSSTFGDSYTLSFLVSLRSPFIHAGLIASRVKHLLNVVPLIDDNSSEVHSTGEEYRIRQDYNYSLRWMSDQLSCLIVHCYVFRFS